MPKSELRKLYLRKRSSLSAGEVALASGKIADRFFECIDLTAVRYLHTFIRVGKFNEIDSSMIYFRLWRDHPEVKTVAPLTDLATGEIESAVFDESAELAENAWGIREPAGGEIAGPAEIDLVIVPLLGFDESGHRVGYGRGMYDRYLARCRADCLKVGLSYFPPVEPIEDVFASDVRLDACVTPDAIFRFSETKQSVPPLSAAPSHQ